MQEDQTENSSEEKTSSPEAESQAKPNKTLAVWIATGLGFGFSPVASGTVGGLWGVPLAIAINGFTPGVGPLPAEIIQVFLIAVLFAFGVPLCTKAAKDLGGKKDPGAIVWDEIVSMPITFMCVPTELMLCPFALGVGFVLNRIFDIAKPFPARQLERCKDGLGIMIDDVFAGIYSCIVMHILIYLGFIDWGISIGKSIIGG